MLSEDTLATEQISFWCSRWRILCRRLKRLLKKSEEKIPRGLKRPVSPLRGSDIFLHFTRGLRPWLTA
jgi:hypothetical protein